MKVKHPTLPHLRQKQLKQLLILQNENQLSFVGFVLFKIQASTMGALTVDINTTCIRQQAYSLYTSTVFFPK